MDLIYEFDWAHTQVGVHVTDFRQFIGAAYEQQRLYADVDMSCDWSASREAGTTWYTGSNSQSGFPLSSLCRMAKYVRYEAEGGPKVLVDRSVMAILSNIIRRGYEDEKDFLNQLHAISTGITTAMDKHPLSVDLVEIYNHFSDGYVSSLTQLIDRAFGDDLAF
jgi:hypothetical protein